METTKEEGVAIDAVAFIEALKFTRRMMSRDETRANLCGVHVDRRNDVVARVVATDGHRLAMIDLSLPSSITFKPFTLTKDVVDTLCKTKRCDLPQLQFVDGKLCQRTNEGALATPLATLDSEFPDYAQVVPSLHNGRFETFTVDRAKLLDTLQACQDAQKDAINEPLDKWKGDIADARMAHKSAVAAWRSFRDKSDYAKLDKKHRTLRGIDRAVQRGDLTEDEATFARPLVKKLDELHTAKFAANEVRDRLFHAEPSEIDSGVRIEAVERWPVNATLRFTVVTRVALSTPSTTESFDIETVRDNVYNFDGPIGCNIMYLIEAVRALPKGSVSLHIFDKLSAFVITGPEGSTACVVQMPTRI